jgi:hypothetical protein
MNTGAIENTEKPNLKKKENRWPNYNKWPNSK